MKARYYWQLIEECDTEEKIETTVERVLKDFIKDADDLIKRRNAKTRDAVIACIREVDQKWKALCRICGEKRNESPYESVYSLKLLEDGFKAVYIDAHPEYSYAFDLKSHIKKVDKLKAEADEANKNSMIYIHPVTPFEDLTLDNITIEILACLHSLGCVARTGLPQSVYMPLACRIHLLRYWYSNGKINLEDVKDFEKDNIAWVQSHQID